MSYITVTFVRHGETDFNSQHLVQGISDISLNDIGITQSKLLGESCKDEKYTRVFSSDLKRAVETCEIILEHSKQTTSQAKLITNLRERSFGELEGKHVIELVNAATENGTSVYNFHAPGGESHDEAVARGEQFVQELCKISDEVGGGQTENVLVVTHGMLLLTLMLHLKSKTDKYNVEHFNPEEIMARASTNTSKTVVRIYKLDPNGTRIRRIEFLLLADISHLK